MALVLADGFDYWTSAITNLIALAGGWTYWEDVRGGGGSGAISVNNGHLSKGLNAADQSATLIFGGSVSSGQIPRDIVSFASGGEGILDDCTPSITVSVLPNGGLPAALLSVYEGWGPAGLLSGGSQAVNQSGGPGGTLLAQEPISWSGSGWNFLEVKVSPSGVIVRLEGVEIINTGGGSGAVLDSVILWNNLSFNDVYILNGDSPAPRTFLGPDIRVNYVFPTSDVAVGWTPSSPTQPHWDHLDSINHWGDYLFNEYVVSNVSGAVDLFEVADAGVAVDETILGVVVAALAFKSDANPRSLALLAGGSQSPDLPLEQYSGTIVWGARDVAWVPPRAWTEAAFNATRFGIKTREASSATNAFVYRLIVQTLVGPTQGGGWGVGFVRMGAN